MRTYFALAALALVACSASDPTSSSSTAAVTEPAPAAKALPVCAYPEGPYGFKVGNVIPPDLKWDGVVAGGSAVTYSTNDFFDCDGSKGLNAVIFDSSAEWCGACQAEAQELEGFIRTTWGQNGVAVITLMMEDLNHKPSTDLALAKNWASKFHLQNVPVVLDPNFDFAKGTSGTIGLPYNVLVNPRTMKVVKVPYAPGAGGHDAAIDALIAANQQQ